MNATNITMHGCTARVRRLARGATLFAIAFAACGDDAAPASAPIPPSATTTPEGPGLPIDHPPLDLPPMSRATTRMTVDQLEASLPIIAGNDANGVPITWTIKGAGNTQVAALSDAALGRTLGRPDYAQVTEEPALPTPLYAKFMDDMARDVCAKMVAADVAAGDQPRTLTRFASISDASDLAKNKANLRYLSLRFLGQKVADGDDGAIADLLTLFQVASGGTDARAGWNAVCVGLLTSPSFHIH